ncbi:hypothetical protein HDK77DRAFT_31157 [Phyllosticta capitalensis]
MADSTLSLFPSLGPWGLPVTPALSLILVSFPTTSSGRTRRACSQKSATNHAAPHLLYLCSLVLRRPPRITKHSIYFVAHMSSAVQMGMHKKHSNSDRLSSYHFLHSRLSELDQWFHPYNLQCLACPPANPPLNDPTNKHAARHPSKFFCVGHTLYVLELVRRT